MNKASAETTASPPPDDPFARAVEDLFQVCDIWVEDEDGTTRKVKSPPLTRGEPCHKPHPR